MKKTESRPRRAKRPAAARPLARAKPPRKLALLELLESLARAANEAATPEAAMHTCLERISKYANWDFGRVAILKAGVAEPMVEASLWLTADKKRYRRLVRVSEKFDYSRLTGKFISVALREKKAVWLEDFSKANPQGRLRDAMTEGLQSGFVFPVIVNGKVAAFLEFFAKKRRKADPVLLDAVGSVGAQLARLLERGRAEAANARLAAVVENSNDAIMTRTLEGIITAWNSGAQHMLGYTAAEAIGKPADFILLPDRQHVVAENNARVVTDQVIPAHETKRVAKNGRIIDVLSSHSPVRDANGKVVAASIILHDITERKRVEAERARLAAIVEGSHDAIISRSLDGVVLSWNAGAERMFGYTAAEIIGKNISIFAPPELAHESQRNTQALLRGEPAPPLETVRLTKDGREIHVQVGVSPIRDASGKVTAIAAIMRDITARKRMEAEHAELAAIVASSQDAIISTAPDRTILTWNSGAERIFGYTAAEAIGRDVGFLVPHDLRHELGKRRAMALRDEAAPPHDTERLTKDGRRVAVSISASLLRDGAGEVIGVALIYRDITEAKRAAAALLESEERFRAAFEQAGVGMGLRSADPHNPRWLRVNQTLCDIFGYTREELLQLTTVDLTPPAERGLAIDYNEQLMRGDITAYTREKQYLRKDGTTIWTNITLSAVRGPDERPTHIISVITDISDRKQAEAAQARLAAIVENSDDAIISRSLDRTILTWNAAAERLFGWSAGEAIGKNISMLVPPERQEESAKYRELVHRGELVPIFDTERLNKRGQRINVSLSQSPIKDADGRIIGVSLIFRDITERKKAEEQIRYLAHYDNLTGLPNRVLFYDRLGQAVALARRDEHAVALLYLDLDGFKVVNDTLGHDAGDELLRAVADRMKSRLRESDTIARVGGDEFIAVLPKIASRHDCSVVAKKILDALSAPFRLGAEQREAIIRASIGIAAFPSDAEDIESLIKAADSAMYFAKQAGNRASFFDEMPET